VKVLIFANNNVFTTQQKIENLGFNKKGTLVNQSAVVVHKETKTDSSLTLFHKDGTMSSLRMLTMGIEAMEVLENGSPVVAAFDFNNESYESLVFVTKNGTVKRTSISEYLSFRASTKAIKLREGDEIVAVLGANQDTYVYILNDKLSKFSANDIPATSRLTIGSKGTNGSAIGATAATEDDKIFTLNEKGQGKLTLAKDFNLTAKGGIGQVITENTVFVTTASELQAFIYSDKKNNIIDYSKISVKGKTAVGAKIVSGSLDSISI